MKVQKFGGTSVGTVAGLRQAVRIVREASKDVRPVVVVSAISGITDMLAQACTEPFRRPRDTRILVDALWARHHLLASAVLQPAALRSYEDTIEERISEVVALLARLDRDGRGVGALEAAILAAGERMSVPLFVAALRQEGVDAVAQDATAIIRTDNTYAHAHVDLELTHRQVEAWFEALRPHVVPVVTGFIGADTSGAVTTLGRGGSDYTASLLASSLKASVLERWTDVDGLYTHDPRTNEQAEPLTHVALEEALAWNQAGRLGMHRKALDPLVLAGIPVHIRSTTAPEKKGTLILPQELQAGWQGGAA